MLVKLLDQYSKTTIFSQNKKTQNSNISCNINTYPVRKRTFTKNKQFPTINISENLILMDFSRELVSKYGTQGMNFAQKILEKNYELKLRLFHF